MLAVELTEHDETPVEDKIVVFHSGTWADYQRLMELRGARSAPRIAFLEGEIEVRSPSKSHEVLKSTIGRLVEVWCLERGIEFRTVGSWTLENKEAQRGVEPDESYIFGAVDNPTRPDLAIEVVWTSGGLDKLDIYRKLGVREVWFWRRGKLGVHLLRGETYSESPVSEVLPGIDLVELARHLDKPTSEAMRAWLAALRAGSTKT